MEASPPPPPPRGTKGGEGWRYLDTHISPCPPCAGVRACVCKSGERQRGAENQTNNVQTQEAIDHVGWSPSE